MSSLYNDVNRLKEVEEEEEDPANVVCPYFKQGLCQKGKKCIYSHDLTLDRTEEIDLYVDQRTQLIHLLRTELEKKQDISTNTLEYAYKHQLDQLSEQISNKLELFKGALVGKVEFEKLNKQVLRKLKEPERVSTGSIINSDKISDSLITKLVQLEQRVCVLEDFYETDSIAGTPEEKLGKEKIFFTSTELNSREIPSLLLSKMTPLKDECGSGFFEGMLMGGSNSPKYSPHYLGNFNQRHSMESKIVH